MSNINKSEQNFVHLIPDKLLKRSPNFVQKYYFITKLIIVEYREQNISHTNMPLHE